MATKDEVLKALQATTRGCPLKPRDLSGLLNAKPVCLSVQLHRLSKEGFVAKKGDKNGWFITRNGKKRLEMLTQSVGVSAVPRKQTFYEKYAKELDAQIEENQDTNYGKFLEYGKMVNVRPNIVLLVAGQVWSMGDGTNLTLVWRTLGQGGMRRELQKLWFHTWRAFLRKPVPRDLIRELK
jgi:hypothetical protein